MSIKSIVFSLACSILLAVACESHAEISNLVPATVSGGSGGGSAIQTDDGVFYSAARGNTVNGVSAGIVPASGDSAHSASVAIISHGRIRVHLTTGIFRIAI